MSQVQVTAVRRAGLMAVGLSLLLACSTNGFAQPGRTGGGAPPPTTPSVSRIEGKISAIGEDGSSLVLVKEGAGKEPVSVVVGAKALQAHLKDFRAGDLVTAEISQEATQVILREIRAAQSVSVSSEERLSALGFGALVLLVVSLVLLRGNIGGLLLGKDGRYSNSKFQMALWFGIVIVTYIALVWLRWWKGGGYIGGVNIAQNLLLISGMSALTLGAAKGITTAKIQAREERELARGATPAAAALAAESAVKPPATPLERGLIWNLVRDDEGRVDLGDFQMVVVTLLAVAVYLLQVYEFLASIEKLRVVTLPDVDATILATFGLGQGAYLTKKYASTGRE